MSRYLPAIVLAAAVAGLTPPAAGDRLVTRDGAEIETRGPWRVEGKLVIFHLPNGTLSSLRVSEVDLDASAEASRRDGPPAAAATAPPPPPVLVLTDRDVKRAAPPPAAATGDDEAGTGEPPGPATGDDRGTGGAPPADRPLIAPAEGLAVLSWETRDGGLLGGIELTGTVINRSDALVIDTVLKVRIPEAGGETREVEAFLDNPTLGPGRQTRFRVPLPDVVALADDPTFVLSGHAARPRIVPEGNEETGGAAGEEAGGGATP